MRFLKNLLKKLLKNLLPPRTFIVELLMEGKTKKIYTIIGLPHLVLMESKNAITKDDDPTKTKTLEMKASMSTLVTSKVFEILKARGIPVAYKEKISDSWIIAEKCDMIPLEVIVRAAADGSYLKRYPELSHPPGQPLHEFSKLVFELFLKTTDHKIVDRHGKFLGKTPVDDPLIAEPYTAPWKLKHPKLPGTDKQSDLGIKVSPEAFLPDGVTVRTIHILATQTFLILEAAWKKLNHCLVDFKIEFGVTTGGKLVIADVIDNDSWRLRDPKGMDLSKQAFRNNLPLEEVQKRYKRVAKLIHKLRVPSIKEIGV